VRVIVEAPARLHLGFIDPDGGSGRRFGSIGLAVERPRCRVEGWVGPATAVGIGTEEADRLVARVRHRLGISASVQIRVRETIPRHAGLGSGTQIELAVATALTRLLDLGLTARELARRLERGRRSGIGVAIFERGGFVVDGGQPVVADPASGVAVPPPVILRHPVPLDWRFVLATPAGELGLHGLDEEAAFRALPAMGDARVGRLCRLVLMQVVPGLVAGDIRGFGEGLTLIQAEMGEYFADRQGGRYASPLGQAVAEFAQKHGAHGVGQSSWGPTVFALVEDEDAARALAAAITAFVGADAARVTWTRARNEGAEISWISD
jgi:beta-ribofuranosylaminobenzene 5'-phosphate synthase